MPKKTFAANTIKIGEERRGGPTGREMWTGKEWTPSKVETKTADDPDWDKVFDEPAAPKSRLELGCDVNDHGPVDTALSVAISAKRQADALERIANVLEKQTNIVNLLSDELRG